MADDDVLAEVQVDACLRAMATCLRRALEDVEAALSSGDTPRRKTERVADALEELGDRLDSCIDWVPAGRAGP